MPVTESNNRSEKLSNWKKALPLLIVFVLSAFFFLNRLDKLPLRLWDESRNAVNAIEMAESGNYLVRTFEGQADMYELKPPLLTWIQSTLIKLIGPNEIAIRLPSALAGVFISLLIFIVLRRRTKMMFALLGSIMFMTGIGVLGPHLFRYGDHDALLTLFFTCTVLAAWKISNDEFNWIPLFALFVLLGIFTKSIVVLTALPGIVIWLIMQRKLGPVLRKKVSWISITIVLLFVAIYYYLRNEASPGYLDQVLNNELFRRYANTSPDMNFEEHGFWYYLVNLFDRWKPMFVFPFLLIHALWKRSVFSIFLLLQIACFWLIISGGSKNFWYDAPLYPLLSLFIAHEVYQIFHRWAPKLISKAQYVLLIPMFYFCAVGYEMVINPSENPAEAEFYNMAWELRDDLRNHSQPNKVLVMNGYYSHLLFYMHALNSRGAAISHKKPSEVQHGDTFTYSESAVREFMKDHNLLLVDLDSTSRTKTVLVKMVWVFE